MEGLRNSLRYLKTQTDNIAAAVATLHRSLLQASVHQRSLHQISPTPAHPQTSTMALIQRAQNSGAKSHFDAHHDRPWDLQGTTDEKTKENIDICFPTKGANASQKVALVRFEAALAQEEEIQLKLAKGRMIDGVCMGTIAVMKGVDDESTQPW